MKLFRTSLDRLSNRALDAIEAQRYGEAEKLCQRLLHDYPEAFDGHERLGLLREAQGRFQEAADQYSEVLLMIERDPQGTDAQTVQLFTARRDHALARVQP
jgi:tetratricopeptide (TPR) repeat protein